MCRCIMYIPTEPRTGVQKYKYGLIHIHISTNRLWVIANVDSCYCFITLLRLVRTGCGPIVGQLWPIQMLLAIAVI
jgi:hypothetical protein